MAGSVARTPQPGDVVRLDGDWYAARRGARLVVDGGELYGAGFVMAVLGASAFRGPSSAYAADQTPFVSCSGGPCPCIPADELTYAGTTEQKFWRWADIPRADGGEEYTKVVGLWSWAGPKVKAPTSAGGGLRV